MMAAAAKGTNNFIGGLEFMSQPNEWRGWKFN